MSTYRLLLALLVLVLLTGCAGYEPEEAPVTDRIGETGVQVRMDQVVTVLSTKLNRTCGGVLVGPSTVLTAGHCVAGRDQWTIDTWYGEERTATRGEARCTTCVIGELKTEHDVAVIHLDRPIELSAYATISAEPAAYGDATAVNRRSEGVRTDHWWKHETRLWPGDSLVFRGLHYPLSYITDRVAAGGDSGSPVFRPETLEVVAVFSGVHDCEGDHANTLARVDLSADWIKERVR